MSTENIEVNLTDENLCTIVELFLKRKMSQATQDHIATNFYSFDVESLPQICYAMIINEGVIDILQNYIDNQEEMKEAIDESSENEYPNEEITISEDAGVVNVESSDVTFVEGDITVTTTDDFGAGSF